MVPADAMASDLDTRIRDAAKSLMTGHGGSAPQTTRRVRNRGLAEGVRFLLDLGDS